MTTKRLIPAGPGLDLLIMVEVLKQPMFKPQLVDEPSHTEFKVPAYSSNIGAAWLALDWCREEARKLELWGPHFDIRAPLFGGEKWIIEFWNDKYEGDGELGHTHDVVWKSGAYQLPLAICYLAMIAAGKTKLLYVSRKDEPS